MRRENAPLSLSLSPSLPPLSLFSTHSSQPTTTRGWGPRSGPPPLPTARDQQQPRKLHSQQTQPPHALCRLPPPTVGAAITAHRQHTNPNSHNYSPTLRAHRARRTKLTTAPTTDTPAAGAYTGTSPSYSIITIITITHAAASGQNNAMIQSQRLDLSPGGLIEPMNQILES